MSNAALPKHRLLIVKIVRILPLDRMSDLGADAYARPDHQFCEPLTVDKHRSRRQVFDVLSGILGEV